MTTAAPSRHRFHALCPYFAMFPEAFAENWIEKTSEPGDLVLDPFCGRGTTPFQALSMGRTAAGCDVNPVAYVVTRAKTNAPTIASLRQRITKLQKAFDPSAHTEEAGALPEFFTVAYHHATLIEILFLKSKLRWRTSDVDCMLAALVLGALHGESEKSPSYLSNQMPRTVATKPAYSLRWWADKGYTAPQRDVFEILRRQAAYRYASPRPLGQATVLLQDMRELHRVAFERPVQSIITSPPYLDVTNYVEDQWLRLWFLGGPPYPTTRSSISRDDRYENRDQYWRLISDMWRTIGQVLAPHGHVVIRIGGKGLSPDDIVDGLEGTSVFSGRTAALKQRQISPMRRRQTRSFRPGTNVGLAAEVDCHFVLS